MTGLLIAYAIGAVLLGAELFTNALEHLGARFHVSEGVTASVFAAVATAMPEASIPVIAILEHAGTGAIREQVATGAILGAPLMLSTVAFLVMGIAAAWKRGARSPLCPEPQGLRRDLLWFTASFSLAALATLLPGDVSLLRGVVAALLVILYARYLRVTIRASTALVAAGHGTRVVRPLHVARLKRFSSGPSGIALQLLSGFFLIVLGTRAFLDVVAGLSTRFPPLALSLMIIPIATELPEKVNSVLWIRRGGQDTLAFGNISGALVFQGTLLPALGIWLTPWTVRPDVLLSIALTLIVTAYVLVMHIRGVLRPYHLLFNGACYVIYPLFLTHAFGF